MHFFRGELGMAIAPRTLLKLPVALVALTLTSTACINGPAVLTQHIEARSVAADLQVQFARAAEAANRAVMADTDEASANAAEEARQAVQQVQALIDRLRPTLQSLGYADEILAMDAFVNRFDEYRKLDDEILPLAVENTNLKAQRLSFGAAEEAVKAFRGALASQNSSSIVKASCCEEALSAKAVAAVLEIQVIQARHIAESDDAAMSHMEAQMATLEQSARTAIGDLKRRMPAAEPAVTAALAALDQFKAVNSEIVALSRRNSNVRSLALSLGRKRVVTAECNDQLRALLEVLDGHRLNATR
jgi:hypothetical protein